MDLNKTVILNYPLEWDLQYGGEDGMSWEIQSSSADSPILITTKKANTLQTGDKVFVFQHQGNLGVDSGSSNTNFTYTRVSATTGTLQGSTGVNAGTGGWIAKAASGTNYTLLKCDLKTSHTQGATVLLSLTFAWVTQSIFKFSFSATTAAVLAAFVASGVQLYTSVAREIYWTNADGVKVPVWQDDVNIISL